MKILVTGVLGQLGHDVAERLALLSIPCVGVDKHDFDLTDEHSTISFIKACSPDAIIHCAAYTAVDRAEQDNALCHAVNVNGTRNVALACRDLGAKMMYISTDYVFDGEGTEPFTTSAPKSPQNQYGLSKALGENEVERLVDRLFIVRTSWVFGNNGANFVRTMLHLGTARDTINVVSDQIGSPTYTFDLAQLLCDMIVTDKYGVYHATNEGFCSWYDFACEIIRLSKREVKIESITTDQYPTPANRPHNSRMDKSTLDVAGFQRLPPWQDALKRYLLAIGELKV